MNVGLPGTGLAGLFYLLAALWMPCHELGRTLRGERDAGRWRCALTQASLALGIIAAITVTAWVVGVLLAAQLPPMLPSGVIPAGGDGDAGTASPAALRFLGTTPTAVVLVTLGIMVTLLEVLGLVVTMRRRRTPPGV